MRQLYYQVRPDYHRPEVRRPPRRYSSAPSFYSAALSVSPVRIRMTRSMSVMKILPSPTLPVLAAFSTASTTWSTSSVSHRDFDPRLRHEIDHVLRAAIQLGMAALASESLDLGNGHAGYADLGQAQPGRHRA